MSEPAPDDLVATAELCAGVLAPLADRDWESPAAGLDWTCRRTIEHVCSLGYASTLANRLRARRPLALEPAPQAPIPELVWTMEAMAHVLAEVARAAPPEVRAHHAAGPADPCGFVAMAMDELLLHTDDIATGLGVALEPEDRLVRLVLDRLFPWWPRDVAPWPALRWANGRGPLPGHPDLGPSWVWHSRPLEEWDGTIPRWDPEAGRLATS